MKKAVAGAAVFSYIGGNKQLESLYDKLLQYREKGIYPFHMPGHKRQEWTMCNPYEIDITEIEGFDDLHHPEGILRQAQEEAAEIYGSSRTWFLVNGSTSGILSAVGGCVPLKGTILMARNCHKSVLNAVFHRGLRPVCVYPQISGQMGIAGSILPGDVEKALDCEPHASAVILVSPTYEGVVSDIRSIAEITRKKGIPLIVDEAHGAHFSFGGGFPSSALKEGADFVIQSLHKTLPSMTQTAVLHASVNARRDWMERVDRCVHLYQSSSPSYILLCAIQRCIQYMAADGSERMKKYAGNLERLRKYLKDLPGIRLAERDETMWRLDPSKLLISAEGVTGTKLGGLLLQNYGLQMEMCTESFVIAMTSLMDTDQGFKRLCRALKEIGCESSGLGERRVRDACLEESHRPKYRMTPYKAESSPSEWLPLEQAAGRVSAETGYLYPPGVAFIVAGEEIDDMVINRLSRYRQKCIEVQGCSRIGEGLLRVVK